MIWWLIVSTLSFFNIPLTRHRLSITVLRIPFRIPASPEKRNYKSFGSISRCGPFVTIVVLRRHYKWVIGYWSAIQLPHYYTGNILFTVNFSLGFLAYFRELVSYCRRCVKKLKSYTCALRFAANPVWCMRVPPDYDFRKLYSQRWYLRLIINVM